MTIVLSSVKAGFIIRPLSKKRPSQPGFEVFAPKGRQFLDAAHSRICADRDEVEFACAERTEPCLADCDCQDEATVQREVHNVGNELHDGTSQASDSTRRRPRHEDGNRGQS